MEYKIKSKMERVIKEIPAYCEEHGGWWREF